MSQAHDKKATSPQRDTTSFLNDLKSLVAENSKAVAAVEKDFRDAYSFNRYQLLND